MVDLKSTMNQFNLIKIYIIFRQQQNTNTGSQRLYTGRHWNISRDIKQGAKVSLCVLLNKSQSRIKTFKECSSLPSPQVTAPLIFAISVATIGSFQYGYNTGVINAPEAVSARQQEFEFGVGKVFL